MCRAQKIQALVCWVSGDYLSAAVGNECALLSAVMSVSFTSFLINFTGDTENINIQPKLRS